MIIDVALACDNNYAWYCAETIVSLLKNTKQNVFYNFYIIQEDLSELNQNKIKKVKELQNCNIVFVNIDTRNSIMKHPVYFRLQLASLLPELDKIIYTDCDVTYLDGLDELWKENIDDYYFANVPDFTTHKAKFFNHFKNICKIDIKDYDYTKFDIYYNAGFSYMNLKKIRDENIEEKMIECLKKYPELPLRDQDLMNLVCNDKIKAISFKWSFLVSYFNFRSTRIKNKTFLPELKYSSKNIKMIHFLADKKPTKIYKSIFRPSYWKINKYKNIFWEYVKLTEWKDEKKPNIIYKFPFNFLNLFN